MRSYAGIFNATKKSVKAAWNTIKLMTAMSVALALSSPMPYSKQQEDDMKNKLLELAKKEQKIQEQNRQILEQRRQIQDKEAEARAKLSIEAQEHLDQMIEKSKISTAEMRKRNEKTRQINKQIIESSVPLSNLLEEYNQNGNQERIADINSILEHLNNEYGINMMALNQQVPYREDGSLIEPFPKNINILRFRNHLQDILASLRNFPPSGKHHDELKIILVDRIVSSNTKAFYNHYFGIIILDLAGFDLKTAIHEYAHRLDRQYGITTQLSFPIYTQSNNLTQYLHLSLKPQIDGMKHYLDAQYAKEQQEMDSINTSLGLQASQIDKLQGIYNELRGRLRSVERRIQEDICNEEGLLSPRDYSDSIYNAISEDLLYKYNDEHDTAFSLYEDLEAYWTSQGYVLYDMRQQLIQQYGLLSSEINDQLDSLYEHTYKPLYQKKANNPKRGLAELALEVQGLSEKINEMRCGFAQQAYDNKEILGIKRENLLVLDNKNLTLNEFYYSGSLEGYVTSYAKTGGPTEYLPELVCYVFGTTSGHSIISIVDMLAELDSKHPGKGFGKALQLHIDNVEYLFGVRLVQGEDGWWVFVDSQLHPNRFRQIIGHENTSLKDSPCWNAEYFNRLHGLGLYQGQHREITGRKEFEQEDGTTMAFPVRKQQQE